MIYIVDTHAWIEYMKGSSKASIFRKLLEDSNNKFITMECCLSEFFGFCLKNNHNFAEAYDMVKTNSVILPVMAANWVESAKIRFELRKNIPHFGLIDAILVSKQKELKCRIISGDPHFKTLKNVVYIGD